MSDLLERVFILADVRKGEGMSQSEELTVSPTAFESFEPFKCGSRYWWRVEIQNTGNVTPSIYREDEDYFETDWKYRIFRDDELVWEGIYSGQYDEKPSLKDILIHWRNEIMEVVDVGVWNDGRESGRN